MDTRDQAYVHVNAPLGTKPCLGCCTPVPAGVYYCAPCWRYNTAEFLKARPWLKRKRP
jgi:hypothetical protein